MASENKASPFAGLPFTPGDIYEVKKEELNKSKFWPLDFHVMRYICLSQLCVQEISTEEPEQ